MVILEAMCWEFLGEDSESDPARQSLATPWVEALPSRDMAFTPAVARYNGHVALHGESPWQP